MFISILYMFGQQCAHHQENYCINVTPGLCHSVKMTVWHAVSGSHVPIIRGIVVSMRHLVYVTLCR